MYSIYEQVRDNYGIKINYYPNNKIAAKMNVRVEYRGRMIHYINEGESIAYEKWRNKRNLISKMTVLMDCHKNCLKMVS